MLKLIFWSILLIACLLYIAETKVSLSPFKVQFARGWYALGLILIGLGIGLIWFQGYWDGAKKGVDTTFKYFIEIIKRQEGK